MLIDGGVTLDVAPTDGKKQVGFDVAISTSSANGLSASITNGVGTLTPPGGTALSAFVYERIPWPQSGFTLYEILAVGPADWHVGWFYCTDAGLSYLDYEATDSPQLQSFIVTGTCNETASVTQETVSLPASTLKLNGLVQGFTVSGPSLSLSGSDLGSMTINGAKWTVFPFALVDCSLGCGNPGWYELHSVYWNAADVRTCFGIYYLFIGYPNLVQIDHSICLPDLGDPTGGRINFQSTWSHP
jgi:hypothetical protein